MPGYNPPDVFTALADNEVDYVTIGGLAVGFWGHARATKDIDIAVPTKNPVNDKRLAAALESLDARPLRLELDAAIPAAEWEQAEDLERWDTNAGVVDVMRAPEGAPPFDEMRKRAHTVEIFGTPAIVVAHEDLIAMKTAAGRVRDLLDVEALLGVQTSEATLAALHDHDLATIAADREPPELGALVDPAESLTRRLRISLAATSSRTAFEERLLNAAATARTLDEHTLRTHADRRFADIPRGAVSAAREAGAAAGEMAHAETQESKLLRERDQTPILHRRARKALTRDLDALDARIEQLRIAAERETHATRQRLTQADSWWQQTGEAAAETIAAQRELYRRHRKQAAQRVERSVSDPAEYITATIGPRAHAPDEKRWDVAARSIEAYAAMYGENHGAPLAPPAVAADRGHRNAWTRLGRALVEAGHELPGPGQDLGLEL